MFAFLSCCRREQVHEEQRDPDSLDYLARFLTSQAQEVQAAIAVNNGLRSELDRVRREKSELQKSFGEKVRHVEALETKLRLIEDQLRKEQETKRIELDRVRSVKSELQKSFGEKVRHAEALETKLRLIKDLPREEQETKDLELTKMREEKVALQTLVYKKSTYITELEQRLERKTANIKAQASQTDQDDIIFSGCDSEMFDTSEFRNTDYHYRPDITDRWFQIEVERSRTTHPPGRSTRAVIRMYNALEDYDVDAPDVRLRNGEKIYYHGTDAHSARNILENGIVLKNSTRPADFSQGHAFYVTKDFNRAVEWSMKIAKWRGLGTHGAVIGFKIGRTLRKEQTHLSLKMSNNEDRILWKCIVCHFRNGETSPDVGNALRGVKFIKGPVSRNAFLHPQQLPSPYNFTQLCIRDSEYASRFGSLENISCVIFFM